MKKLILIATCSLFIFGCNKNPNKEARIQKLENSIQELEEANNQLKARVLVLKKKMIVSGS